jgi:hypothetical protein
VKRTQTYDFLSPESQLVNVASLMLTVNGTDEAVASFVQLAFQSPLEFS